MSTSYKRISNIKEYDDAKPLEIRVIKKWIPDLQSLDFCYVFVDVHGDAIQVTASLDEESNFNLKITTQSCYIVDKYISLPQKSHNLVVPHRACLRIGKKATFIPITNNDIPNHYYNFANYNDLPSRTKPPKMLTERFQLETTVATTIEINPTSSYARTYVDRIQKLSPKSEALDMDLVTIAELLAKNTQERTQKRFSYLARVKSIHNNRNWYYVLCPNCQKKCILKRALQKNLFVKMMKIIENPKFMYCVNTTITDDTSVADVVFFNDAMTNLLNIKCEDMIITHGYTDQHVIPDKMLSIINKTKLIVVSVKPDYTIVVNNVHEPPSNVPPSSTTSPVTLTPKTPTGKTISIKRPHQKLKDKEA